MLRHCPHTISQPDDIVMFDIKVHGTVVAQNQLGLCAISPTHTITIYAGAATANHRVFDAALLQLSPFDDEEGDPWPGDYASPCGYNVKHYFPTMSHFPGRFQEEVVIRIDCAVALVVIAVPAHPIALARDKGRDVYKNTLVTATGWVSAIKIIHSPCISG